MNKTKKEWLNDLKSRIADYTYSQENIDARVAIRSKQEQKDVARYRAEIQRGRLIKDGDLVRPTAEAIAHFKDLNFSAETVAMVVGEERRGSGLITVHIRDSDTTNDWSRAWWERAV